MSQAAGQFVNTAVRDVRALAGRLSTKPLAQPGQHLRVRPAVAEMYHLTSPREGPQE